MFRSEARLAINIPFQIKAFLCGGEVYKNNLLSIRVDKTKCETRGHFGENKSALIGQRPKEGNR